MSLTVTWLQLLDVAATWLVLHTGGREANPLQAMVLAQWGVPGMLLDKVIFSLLCAFGFWLLDTQVRARWLFRLASGFACLWMLMIICLDLLASLHFPYLHAHLPLGI